MNLKQSFRIIFRNKTYSILNIAGLAIGIAAAALILLWVEDELTFNRTFPKSNDLYLVGQIQRFGDDTRCFFVSNNPIAQSLATDYPGIKQVSNYSSQEAMLSTGDGVKIFNENGVYVDSTLFGMLDIRLQKGDLSRVFEPANAIAISEDMAKKFFGDEDPIGKTLKMDNDVLYQITGVFEKPAKNSSFNYEWLASIGGLFRKYPNEATSWNNWMQCYVELEPSANVEAINEKLQSYFPEKTGGENNTKLFLYPVNQLKLYSEFKDGNFTGSGDIRKVRLFTAIAFIILLIACINFMNLSTARSQKRAMEVGVCKTFGAKRPELIRQFIKESGLITLLSLLLALLIVWLALPSFNILMDKKMEMQFFNPVHLLGLIGVGLFCTVLAGSYPALYLSSFNPISTLKQMKVQAGSNAARIRKVLVVFQFAVSFILICTTVVIYLQIRHVHNRPIGYNKEQVMMIKGSKEICNNFQAIHNEFQNTGFVVNSALSDQPILGMHSNGWGYLWPGQDPNADILITQTQVSSGLFETLQMKLEGRDFNSGSETDDKRVIINRRLAEMMGEEGRIGGMLGRKYWDAPREIIGIVDDFVFNDMFSTAQEPVAFFKSIESGQYLFVCMKPQDDIQAGVSKIESIMKRFNPGYPFEYSFMDEDFDRFFQSEKQVGTLASLFAVLTIFISCLGLFGLSAFSAEQRKKEIGIRKVLGASVWNLAKMLVRNFMVLICLSFIIGIPIAWYVTNKWLGTYEYRINENWMIFAGTALLVILIAILTVIFQTLRVAMANPVKSIKTE